ncbi:MAG: hypothetical protein PHP69_07090 [Candidatus Omnitrophica bacterium]|nr:hypothetical protein [Candidatus Omnitrophota bacterium]MDD5081711.1 hypothetical protein [Candidatus Omnitrophota bacterium]
MKKKWVMPVVTKIRLNSEQAVLSCCNSEDKSPHTTWVYVEYQCVSGIGCALLTASFQDAGS